MERRYNYLYTNLTLPSFLYKSDGTAIRKLIYDFWNYASLVNDEYCFGYHIPTLLTIHNVILSSRDTFSAKNNNTFPFENSVSGQNDFFAFWYEIMAKAAIFYTATYSSI